MKDKQNENVNKDQLIVKRGTGTWLPRTIILYSKFKYQIWNENNPAFFNVALPNELGNCFYFVLTNRKLIS